MNQSIFPKFLWSIAVTLVSMSATFLDGETDLYLIADQSLGLFFAGFGAVVVGLVVSSHSKTSPMVVEVEAKRLLYAFFWMFVLFITILVVGKFKDSGDPSYVIAGIRTTFGALTMLIGLWLAEGFILRERDQ